MALPWNYGVWTYRSLFNLPDPAKILDDILLAEGEMTFEAAQGESLRGELVFRSEKLSPSDPRLTLLGSIESGSPGTIRFRGVGDPKTGANGWVYDYVAYLVPNWPSGVDQRPAIVGSVTRAVDHTSGDGTVHRAGAVFSFVAVLRDFPEARQALPLAQPVLGMLASRHHRLHHFVWHTVRNYWLDDSTITPDMKLAITELGWAPPRPVLSASADPLFGNHSGEDFLFMHRQMVIEVNAGLQKLGQPPIRGWSTIPGPGPLTMDPDYSQIVPTLPPPGNPTGFSVPASWSPPGAETMSQRLQALKSAEFYWSRMRWWDRQYKDPAYLATLSLGELGTLIEWTVHNDMHMRWASVPRDPKTNEPVPQGRQDWDIDPAWDDDRYDHLGEQYSSHVNPVFWRLHGWVDNRVEDWFNAREATDPGKLNRTEVMGTPWFEGVGVDVDMPWSGPMDMKSTMAMDDAAMDEGITAMEAVIHIIFPKPDDQALLKVPLVQRLGPLPQGRSRF